MLQNTINDKHYAWKKGTFQGDDISFRLTDSTKSAISQLPTEPNIPLSLLEPLIRDVERFKEEHLEKGYGLGIIDTNPIFTDLHKQRNLFMMVSRILGDLAVQNSAGETVIEVVDRGKTMGEGGRYHQTRQGGSNHTDCPQWERSPRYFGLFCVHPANEGGESKFISACSVHNAMLQNYPSLLAQLYLPFIFDKRGDIRSGEAPTIQAPIFTYDGRELVFRYLRDYVLSGHERSGQPLTSTQISALEALDGLLESDDLTFRDRLGEGQMIFVNNYRTVHGRTSFVDNPGKKRLMLRTWIHPKGNSHAICQ